MSDLTIKLNEKVKTWTCSGTGDTLIINVHGDARDGIQLEANGLDFTGTTLTAFGKTGAQKVLEIPDEPDEILLVGTKGFVIFVLELTNCPAGEYKVAALG